MGGAEVERTGETFAVSPVRSIERKEAKEALLAAFDMLGDDDNAGIFRDQYGLVLKDNLGACDRTRQDRLFWKWNSGRSAQAMTPRRMIISVTSGKLDNGMM